MKKYSYLILCVLYFLTICSNVGCSVRCDSSDKTVVDSERFYCIYKEDTDQFSYILYDSNGKKYFSETTNHPINIDMLNEELIIIKTDMGSGISVQKFYNVLTKVFSEEFTYVFANSDNLVAYIDVPKEHPYEYRKIVVRDIFDINIFYEEFQLDFSCVDTPVLNAVFLNNEALQVTYLSGVELTEQVVILELGQGDGLREP